MFQNFKSLTCVHVRLSSLIAFNQGSFALSSETPKTVNTKLKKVNGFVGALLVWGAVQKVWPRVKFIKRSQTYNNIEVAWYVYGKKIPVIVKVYAPQIGALSHWVLYVGDRTMIDPWTGKGIPTSTYQAIGYALYDKV